jgi:hypothetical protein
MADWLTREGYQAESLRWWVNYGCRDDYGTDYRQVSAWAGLHYFASRHGSAANADSDDVLVWPEGNAWLTRRLAARIADHIVKPALAYRMGQRDDQSTEVEVWLADEARSVRYRAKRVIWAAPVGFLAHAWPDMPAAWRAAARQFSYAPWLVANLTLKEFPAETGRHAAAWDNVTYGTAGLGYVVATHQRLDTLRRDTVLTYYRPLSEYAPAAGRHTLLATTREVWARQIMAELSVAHPDLPELVSRLDVWRWGHAMSRPTPGLISTTLPTLRAPSGRVMIAHADLSGFSIAEEAHYWGVRAARWVLGEPDWGRA